MDITSSSNASSYNVFLSFRGTDTRYGFTGNLYKALTDKGFHTFIDDEELQRGEEITPSLVKAIQESMIAIIVLSKSYASSSFCLDELATIIHCKTKGMLVMPVFYKVDPSDVRHQKGSYGDALAKHEKRFKHNMEILQKWKEALYQVADLSGFHFKDGVEYEYKFIENIVESVSKKINHPACLRVGDYLVGLESRVAEVMKLLDVGSGDVVHMVGIQGMGGVGKSTLARAVYNNLVAEKFDGSCYLENVREESEKHGLKHLQLILLQEILGDEKINLTSVERGASMIQQRLQRKKVLLVLDDVDKLEQLKAIVGSAEWFGPGSRVIITTRDQQPLACHQVKRIYEVKTLNFNDARQLLTWKAFQKEKADPTYEEVLNRVLTYASGLPLALEVIGSNLLGMSVEEWKSAIEGYERIPDDQILKILKISFNALKEDEKSVFLDISCCFKGYALEEVEDILRARYGNCMKYQIRVLIKKSLLKLDHFVSSRIRLHDLIEEMGKAVVRQESPENDPEKQSRLWLPKDIIQVLEGNAGTSKIEIIYLDVPVSNREEIIEWDGNGFKEMKNLKILIIKNVKFSQVPKCLPNSLRVLEWWRYPSNCLPSDFQPRKLVMCNLPLGCFTSFKLNSSSKMFQNLKVLKFDWCKSLTQIGDVSDLKNLEKLSFKCCDNLVTVHESVGRLGKVKEISALDCWKLVNFPPIRLISLEKLDLTRTGLESFPEILGKMEHIRRLQLAETHIKELPISFVNLIGLQEFVLSGLDHGVIKLPSSIVMMPELTCFMAHGWEGMKWVKEEENEITMGSIVSSKLNRLTLSWCELGDDFFSIIGFTRFTHVKQLNLSWNNFTFLPECIKEFQSLEDLNLSHCQHLQEIRGVPPKLRYFKVSGCKHLQEIRGVLPNIKYFKARNCKSMTSLTTSMFVNEGLYKAGMKECCLPGAWIPEWFDEKSRGPSTSLWFRNKLPTDLLCLLITSVVWKFRITPPDPVVFINGNKVKVSRQRDTDWMEMDHTYIFELDLKWYNSGVALGREWNHMEVTYVGVMETSIIKATGIHVFKGGTDMEDIRSSDPTICRKRKLEDYLNNFDSDNRGLLKRCRLVDMEEQIEQQQNCIVSCLLKWACTYFFTQCSHCIIM